MKTSHCYEGVSSPRVFVRGEAPDMATSMAILHALGIWDALSVSDREAWFNRAEVLDTPGGHLLLSALEAAGGFA